jgi:hypothetical protein
MWVFSTAAGPQNDSQLHSTTTRETIMTAKTAIPFKGKFRDDYLDLVMKFPMASLTSRLMWAYWPPTSDCGSSVRWHRVEETEDALMAETERRSKKTVRSETGDLPITTPRDY